MQTLPRICVVVPVYNHGATVGRIVRESRGAFPVIVVDDGSTDQGPEILARESDITLLTLPVNRGKAAALQAGFAKADALGFTHAITIDADGQHPTDALARFATCCREQPEALITGVRDLKAARAPLARRLSNALSAFCFRLETGLRLPDTQCGYRAYPLSAIQRLRVGSDRYAYELEVMVKAAWAGIPLRPQPVQADYTAPTSRLSHFRPLHDFWHIFWAHVRLMVQGLRLPAAQRRLRAVRDSSMG